jgi:predicted dinucleotide-utilizing enzyme
MNEQVAKLRREAEHCRELARSQYDRRVMMILEDMAKEYDAVADAAEVEAASNGSP